MTRTRREFIRNAAFAGAGVLIGGSASGKATRTAPARAGDFAVGALLHLGYNMWGDWTFDGRRPASAEEEAKMFPNSKPRKNGSFSTPVCDYLAADEAVWRGQTELMRDEGLNMVIIDVGEAYAYPTHPELWVKGAWDAAKFRAELRRLRGLGLEPVPKLNFSAGHDIWLKQYHYMTSTPKYYDVVADVIRDVCEVFDGPRYFHLGFDEEVFAAVKGRSLAVMRQGDLWWHDLRFCVDKVERHGARAIVWHDKICGGRDDFFKNMPKSVVQMPWYYGTNFSEEKLAWKPEFEKSQTWDVQKNLVAGFAAVVAAGYDVMPCTSNWSNDDASDAMLAYVRKAVPAKQLKGVLTAPWRRTVANQDTYVRAAIRQLAAATRKHFG